MVLVTGANGFVGSALCRALANAGLAVTGAVRRDAGPGQVAVGNLDRHTDWRAALAGCHTVIHCAARVHVMQDDQQDPLSAYREVNLEASLQLARQAIASGVRRFVFVSSVKVNGEATGATPFGPGDTPHPVDPYGQSKLEAEQALLALGRESGLEVVIVRPPLVYGPGVKANFLSLIQLVRKGLPLPFGGVRNARSMVALDNLVDLLLLASTHPAAPGRVFMVSDGVDLSIGELAAMIGRALGKPLRALPVPVGLMTLGAALLGKRALVDRLFGSLQVDITETHAILGWRPKVTPQQAIDETVRALLAQQGRSGLH